jgi:hypothetical protein
MDSNNKLKYLKYKSKYLKLKQLGGEKPIFNILYLCATNSTKNRSPPKLEELVKAILKLKFSVEDTNTDTDTGKIILNNYFLGNNSSGEFIKENENQCAYHLAFERDNTIAEIMSSCNYTENFFDIIIAEYCPHCGPISVWSELTIGQLTLILKPGGILVYRLSNPLDIGIKNKAGIIENETYKIPDDIALKIGTSISKDKVIFKCL